MATLRKWLWRLFFLAIWIGVYSILPEPLDAWFGIVTGLAIAVWFYDRLTSRYKLRPIPVQLERIQTITLTHVLLGFILLVMIASFRELVSIKDGTSDVQTSITDFQNNSSSDADEIKDKLDDITNAVEANQ
jgi:hypothetical protein